MSKVVKPSPDPPAAARSRSDSFVRMLELEKMCKVWYIPPMHRIQQDHASSTSTGIPPRTSFPSVIANPSAPRSRRASGYPPLSHQTQIMKAVRQSVALPSLSLSIPPSPAQAMKMRPDGSVEEFSLAKEERAKTVTFSEPEDQEFSDDSSICQSPSWEQYGQKKKKKPKKVANQKIPKEKEDTALKKKANRLIKSAPTDPFTVKPLTTSDRSYSAPELDNSFQSNQENLPPLTANPQIAMSKQQTPGKAPGSEAKAKPKSRGFLSGFRLHHGNVAAVQKLMEARKGASETEHNEQGETLRSIQYETIPVQQPSAIRPGMDSNNPKSRRPSSIRSIISTSDHSLSSQERRSSGTRTSTGSGHGRSQSLLSSTLNKLRGPSYLYYHPSEEGSAIDPSKHSSGSQDIGAVHANPADVPNNRIGKSPGERNQVNLEHPQQPFDFSFPPKPRRMNTEPGPDIAPRGRQPRSRKIEIQLPNAEQGTPILRPSGSRRVQIEIPQASTRDTVMAMVTAQERQSQAVWASQQVRSNIGNSNQGQTPMMDLQSRGAELERRHTVPRNLEAEVHRSGNTHAGPTTMPGGERLVEREGHVTPGANRNEKLVVSERHVPEDDQVSVGTYASTIRPASQSHESGLAEGRRYQHPSHTDGADPDFHPVALERLEVRPKTVPEGSVDDLITFEKDSPDTLQQPMQPQRDMDYFASFSDSFSLPVLDLQSPTEGRFPSPQFLEESDEDSGRGILHDHSLNGHTKQTTITNERGQKATHATDSHSKATGRTLNGQKAKGSPATSTQYSDSDVPAFERLGLSSKAAKILSGAETASTSTAHSQHTDPSRATSERSSSSTCDDSPPSPSSATTPDSSRPQSRKGVVTSQPESSRITLLESMSQTEGRLPHKNYRGPFSERLEDMEFRSTRADAGMNEGGWSQEATAVNFENQPTPTLTRVEGLTVSPSLVATPTSVSFADILREEFEDEGEQDGGQRPVPSLPPRAQSALDLHSTTKLLSHSSRQQRLHLKSNEMASSVSLPSSPPPESVEEVMPRKSALKMSRNNSTNGLESSTAISMGAAYLQEARKTAPVPTPSSSRVLRPHYSQKHSSGSIKSAVSSGNRAEPLAKMLVECCNCHFFHDMPSRVYECMAKPDSVVEDKSLGVSAAITTTVRCPWCAHGMTTQCCSGYAAVVYLKEKLHGK
ncbi:hypothetical protein HD806DRAFT_53535 [Xylariaceae sp. AK1471]|nr:hypothetical protein HD806DRAFT_53535 [Xylariaceae sp. AK1471]